MKQNELDFFIGAISPTGFCGYYNPLLQSMSACGISLLKGGPGCGKSTLLCRAKELFAAQGETIEALHCAGDPTSLDGVVCRAKGFCAIDATPPHTQEPRYPIAVERIVSLYSALDAAVLRKNRSEIVTLFDQNSAWNERAARYITAAGSLLQDTARVALCFTDTEKARCFAQSLSRKYIPIGSGGAREDLRMLSAVTCDGLVFYEKTLAKLADTVIVLDDEFGAAGKVILEQICAEALAKGQSVISCYCSLNPYDKMEHLILPDLRLCFATHNVYHPITIARTRTIHCTRFCSQNGIKLRRKRLRFNQKATTELLEQAVVMLREAKNCHDALEKFYTDALAIEEVEQIYRNWMNDL
ncbi:MAG: hypothetical protein RSD01_06030 [Ruthenibacterium sp.]